MGKALELIHERPAAPWTVATLASEVCVSRAAFARRFRELVGEAPVAYLTRWRLDLAADELQDPARKIAAVAEAVGYESQFAFSHAFKRQFGCSPSEYRQA